MSRTIPAASAADPGLRIDWNLFSETRRSLSFAQQDRTLFHSILGVSWFWSYVFMSVTQLPNLSKNVLAGAEHVATLLLVAGSAAIAIGAFLAAALLGAGLATPQLMLLTALLNAAVAVYIYTRAPEFLVRFMVWMLIHSAYRLKTSNLERIPGEGPAAIISNHVSYVDALVISAACRRPIAPARIDSLTLQRAYDAIARELAAGQLVDLFPEAKRTLNGEMNEFKGGIRKILDRTPVPVVPLALRGLWQSIFARNRDKHAPCNEAVSQGRDSDRGAGRSGGRHAGRPPQGNMYVARRLESCARLIASKEKHA